MQSFHTIPGSPKRVPRGVTFLLAVFLAGTVLVSGCFDSSDDALPTQLLPTVLQTKAGGIWTGTWTDDLTGESYTVSGVVREDNLEGRFVTDSGPRFLLRNIIGTEGDMSATIAATPSVFGDNFQDGSFYTTGVLTGFVDERTSIEGSWSLDSGETGTIVLEYDELYERGSDLARLVGTWECSVGTICNIDALGEIFGQGEDECVATGQIEVIDALYNVYQVTYGSPCMISGVLSGLGVLADESSTNDAFVIMLDPNFIFFYTDTFVRQ
jgi:hypothetical protein